MTDNKATGGGVGILTVIFIVLLILKLANVINMSWIWVFSPIWIPAIFALALFVIMALTRER